MFGEMAKRCVGAKSKLHEKCPHRFVFLASGALGHSVRRLRARTSSAFNVAMLAENPIVVAAPLSTAFAAWMNSRLREESLVAEDSDPLSLHCDHCDH